MAKKTGKLPTIEQKPLLPEAQDEFEEMLWGRHAEVQSYEDLMKTRGTPIPTLFGLWYPFVQNPSTVSVDTFKRMVDTDDTIGSGVDFLTSCLAARLGRYQHESEEITEFVNAALDRMQGGFVNAIKEMLSATWVGFSVTEVQWEDHEELGFVPRRLLTLPPMTLLFETTRTGELTPDGILQYQRNWNPMMQGPGSGFGNSLGMGMSVATMGIGRNDPFGKLGDLPFPLRSPNPYNFMCLRIPTQKCIHYAFDAQGKFGNPYGRSLLRRAYKYYVIKDAILQMMTIALDRKGTPLTIVYADPNTTLEDPDKTDGTNPRGQRGKGIRADMAARNAFKNVHNDSVIFLPGKEGEIYNVRDLPQSSNASDFIAALDFCNKSMLRAMLIPSLIFGNGDGTGSYSLGQEHARTFDKILDSMLGGFQAALLDQLIKPLVGYNFPESSWKKDGLGSFSKRTLSQDEIQKEMETFEKGVNIGIIDQQDLNDLNKMRETIGFETRDKPIERPNPLGAFGEEGGVDEEGNPIEPKEGEEAEAEEKDPKAIDEKKPAKKGDDE